MNYHAEEKRDALFPHEKLLTAGKFNETPATIDIPLAGDGLLPKSNDQRSCIDYSEEAIPERDPAYRLPMPPSTRPRRLSTCPQPSALPWSAACNSSAGALLCGIDAVGSRTEREASVPARCAAAPCCHGDERAGSGRQASRHGRPVRRNT